MTSLIYYQERIEKNNDFDIMVFCQKKRRIFEEGSKEECMFGV